MSCGTCGCNETDKPIQYKCTCEDDCECSVIGFDTDPGATPYCCGKPMERIK